MKELATVIYRLPFESDITKVVGPLIKFDPTTTKAGFVLAPFHYPKTKAFIVEPEYLELIKEEHEFPHLQLDQESEDITKDNYKEVVAKAIEMMSGSSLSKVVLSRQKNFKINSLRPEEMFKAMTDEYPEAFIYLINHPGLGTWMGASPEILLKRDAKGYETVALAGTMRTEDKKAGKQWSKKEIDEQKYVADYIVDRLRKVRANEILVNDRRTIENGPVCHLSTDIRFQSEMPIASLLSELHPTPAVCGTPSRTALEFIIGNEGYDRALYTGFLGPHLLNNRTQIFVNLRCMKLSETSATLYVGAGITGESKPDDEWQETENKGQVLISVLQKIGT